MKNYLPLFISLLLVSVCFADDVQNLVQTEREFAAMSVKLGMREAFLAYLADDSVLFRPDAVSGKQWMEEHPPRAGILSWEPTVAEAGSDLGYTTGPWEFHDKSMQDKPVAYGYFVTLWKKQADGKWKVVLDTGTSNPSPATPATLSTPANAQTKSPNEPVFQTDTMLCGTPKRSADVLADNVVMYRDNAAPVAGKEAALPLLNQPCTPMKGFASSDDLLGYTYGRYEKGTYVRVWKNISGVWKILIDVSTPD